MRLLVSDGKHDHCIRGFIHSTQAWYRDSLHLGKRVVDEVMFGFYALDGGTTGEMKMNWELLCDKPVPRLCVFDDAWSALYQFNDVLAKLSDVDGENITAEAFCELLLSCGFVDMTERTRGVKSWHTAA